LLFERSRRPKSKASIKKKNKKENIPDTPDTPKPHVSSTLVDERGKNKNDVIRVAA
jgi:hypothetical protein